MTSDNRTDDVVRYAMGDLLADLQQRIEAEPYGETQGTAWSRDIKHGYEMGRLAALSVVAEFQVRLLEATR